MEGTNFQNGVLSRGLPVEGAGTIPMTMYGDQNRYYFVDGRTGIGSDSYDGLTPDRPFATIAKAITVANALIGDWSGWGQRTVIVIAPEKYAENLTSLPYGATMIGLGDAFDLNGERGVTIKPASGSPVDVTSCINMRIENICFESPDTSVVFQADNFNRNVIKNCVFSGLPGASTTTVKGLETVKDMTGNLIHGCVFQVCRNGIYVVTDNANSKQASGNIIEYCYVRGADQTGMFFHANCVPSYTTINHCVIGDGSTTLALGLDDNSGKVMVANTVFEATACDPASGDSDSHYNACYLNGTLMT